MIGFLLITLYIFDVSVYRTVSGGLLSSFIHITNEYACVRECVYDNEKVQALFVG